MAKILIIDDSIIDNDSIRQSFNRQVGLCELTFAPDGKAGLGILERETFSALFVSQYLPDMDGIEFLKRIKDLRIEIPVIMLTQDSGRDTMTEALREGAIDILTKNPVYFDCWPFVYEKALARFELEKKRQDLENLIKRSQQQLMALIDSITDYIFMTDLDHRIVRTNRAMAMAFNRHPREIIGIRCYELFGIDNSKLVCKFPELPKTEELSIGDRTYLVSVFPLEYENRELFVHVMKDMTEMKMLKEQLYYSEKLASLGLLVSGVAHEINNPLTGIIAYTELLNMRVKDEDVRKDLDKIMHSAERCKKIVENLLTFSRQKTPSRSLESINDIIDKAIDLRAYWLRTGNIEIVKDYGQNIPPLYIDAQQIQQVFLNLILNAEHAIAESKKERGMIRFLTSFDGEKQRVIVKVTDNGTGIARDVLPRIFDPFFTTKPVGKGTGLGLSISHGIVSEHGGEINVESNVGEGTTFVIKLPVYVEGMIRMKEN